MSPRGLPAPLHEHLRAVIADPDHDPPRLAYARAAAAGGDGERAVLIKAACTLATSPDRADLEARCDNLLAANAGRWNDEVGLPELGVTSSVFRRGFVEQVRVRAPRFLRCVADLFASAPVNALALANINEVRIRDLAPLLTDETLVRSVRAIELTDLTWNRRRVEAVFCPHSAAVTAASLELSASGWDDPALRALSWWARDAGTTELTIDNVGGGDRFGQGSAMLIAAFPRVSSFRVTAGRDAMPSILVSVASGDRPLRALAIELSPPGAGSRVIQAIAAVIATGQASGLERLRIRGLDQVSSIVEPLSNCPALRTLRVLELGDAGYWPRDTTALFLYALLETRVLEELRLHGVRLDGGGFQVGIADNPRFTTLRTLALEQCEVGDHELGTLLASPHLGNLARLRLRWSERIGEPSAGMVRRLRERFGHGLDVPA